MKLYGVKVLPAMRVRMRDGVELAVKIVRPDAPGEFPALMSYSAYRVLPVIHPSPSEQVYSNGVHAAHYFAERGYVSVYYDARGTGSSGGVNTEMYSNDERTDGYEMVEWIARQSWCNGCVGMWGKSYGAIAALQVAALAPPHLRAIIVRSGTDDLYRDWAYPGGSPRSLVMYGGYTALMTALNFAPPYTEYTGELWHKVWQEHLLGNRPWSLAMLEHPMDDEHWAARSVRPNYARIQCAVFLIEGWADWYQTAALRTFTSLRVPKRILIGPWAHYWPEDAFPGPRIDARPEYLRWFDQFLKGIDTGVLKEPPVTFFVRKYQPPGPLIREEAGFWRREETWPPVEVQSRPLFLSAGGELLSRVAEATARHEFQFLASTGVTTGILGQGLIPPWAMPLDQRADEAYSSTYTSAPLEADLEITGNLVAHLFVSSTAKSAYFHVKLCDVAPDGNSKLISDGGLNAARRMSDTHPEALRPGEILELKIPMRSLAYVIPADHRVRVSIAGADFQNSWPLPDAGKHTIHSGRDHPSHILLPVMARAPASAPPCFAPSPNLPQSDVPAPKYIVQRDLTLGACTVQLEFSPLLGHAPGVSRTTYSVSEVNPGRARIKNAVQYDVPAQEHAVQVCVKMLTASTGQFFRHAVDVEVTIDGEARFRKRWRRSFRRKCN